MRPWLLAIGLSAACSVSAPERSTARVDGAPSNESTAVFLFEYQEIPQPSTPPLHNVLHMGSGVLLCPNVVLTVQHVVDHGVFAVSNQPSVVQWADAILTAPTGERERTKLGLALPEDARIVGEPITRPVPMRCLVGDGSEQLADDGLTLLRLDRPYPADLPYPTLASEEWTVGQQGQVHGYGDTNGQIRDAGTRRTATFTRVGTLGLDADPRRQFVLFGDEPRRIFGDSGGPLFGPLPGRGLAGIVQGIVSGRGQATIIPIRPHFDWLREQRDALCVTASGTREVGLSSAERAAPDRVQTDGVILESSGDAGQAIGPDVDVCLCDDGDDCEARCGGGSDPMWYDDDGWSDSGACTCADDCGCFGDCCDDCWLDCQ